MSGRPARGERTVTDRERRARLGRRHHLAPGCRAPDVATAAGSLLGLHASDPSSVYLAARARVEGLTPAGVEAALYGRAASDRPSEQTRDVVVVRKLAMRRTLFVMPLELVPIAQAACADDVAAREAVRLAKQLETDGVAPPEKGLAWLAEQRPAALAALAGRGEATAAQLAKDVPALAQRLLLSPGKRYAATVSVASRLLTLLDAEGAVVRGRPGGSWISTQYKWRPAPAADGRSWPAEEARVELARRWLAAFGPGTEADLKWWTGWNLGQTRAALAALDLTEVTLEGGEAAFVLAGDLEPVPDADPWVALLPALDPTAMGWTGRDWYLGPHREALFDRNGNIGPTIWSDGRIVGGWAQRADGTVATELLEDVGAEVAAAIAAEVAALREWLDDRRFTCVFATPVERRLLA